MYEDTALAIGGYSPGTTNNRMELQAVLEALKALKVPCDVKIFTDSQYAIGGINLLIGSRYASAVNSDLWWKLLTQIERHTKVHVDHVEAHAGHRFNEYVDRLAKRCRTSGVSFQQRMKLTEVV